MTPAASALPRRDVLFLGVLGRRFLHHGSHDAAVGLDPVGNRDPLRAVPLQEFDGAAAFVIRAGAPDRGHEPEGADLLQPLLVDVQILEAPLHLFAGDRLALAKLLLGSADALDPEDALDDAGVVVLLADPLWIIHIALVAATVDVLEDRLQHGKLRARRMKTRRDVA